MKKILIVDDEKDIVETLSFMLKTKGFECICAYDGEMGLSLAKSEKPEQVREVANIGVFSFSYIIEILNQLFTSTLSIKPH